MTYKEAVEVLQTIHEMYPRAEITKRKVTMFVPQLEKDIQTVMEKLGHHAATSPSPPTLPGIVVYLPKENDHLTKVKEWEREAADVPRETKKFQHENRKQWKVIFDFTSNSHTIFLKDAGTDFAPINKLLCFIEDFPAFFAGNPV